MVDFDRSPWKNIHSDLALFRFQGNPNRATCARFPVLMLHGPMTSHRTWDSLGDFLWNQGFDDLYAVDIADIQMGASLRDATEFLQRVISWLLEQYTASEKLVLIGHSTGGVLARRFLLKTLDVQRVGYVFTLGSPHTHTHFSHTVYVPPEESILDTQQGLSSTSMVQTPDIPQDTFIINILGNAVGQNFDGTVHGVFLPEAVNLVMPLAHANLKHDEQVMNEILACLRGERFRMQLFLQSLYMRTPDQDDMVGPFYFEVNGMRSPHDGIFQAVADHYYDFGDSSTPLATLAYPVDQSLVSTVFRLKDGSRARPVRRRLFAKLLDSLSDDQTIIHEMQDNEGSRITLRIRTQRMPALLNSG